MYRKKILAFAVVALVMVFMAGALTIWSTRMTASNIVQVNMANALLTEHWKLSDNSYRLFKQITDELLFGKNANQSLVRNKRALISDSIDNIRTLEQQQRAALGAIATKGTIEDTEALDSLIDEILAGFDQVMTGPASRTDAEKIRFLLEEQIDNRFREAINAAVQRQTTIVNSLNSDIESIHQNISWSAVLITVLAFIAAFFGSYALIRNISIPVDYLKKAAESFAAGNLDHRVPRGFDSEFDAISAAFNEMAHHLAQEKGLRDKLNSQLEFEVNKRTNELTELNEALQKNDATRRSFLADVSHELRTPLTIIRGETQVALRQDSHTEASEYRSVLKSVNEQALLLSRLVDDLLFIARTDANNLQLNLQPANINNLITECMHGFERQASQYDIELGFKSAQDNITASVDPERFQQLLRILLDNAIKYSPPHSRVSISCERSRGHVMISVQDQGPGVSEDEMPFIFDRFYRSQRMRQEKPSGSGLGLSIAKSICEAHGAVIWASNIEHGFVISFKLALES
ncbi:MAG: ATP-binding protein [Pseudomonadota bacterium]|nr:ATP-binding protein [Pseudomonadota bacterium]